MNSRSSRPGLAREAVIGQIRVASGGGRGSPRPPRGCPGYNPKLVPGDPRLCPAGRPPPALPLGSSLGPPRREGSRPPSSGSAGAEHPHGRGCLWRLGHGDQGSRSSLGGAENEPAPGGRGAHAGKSSRESAVASQAPASARLRLPSFSLCVVAAELQLFVHFGRRASSLHFRPESRVVRPASPAPAPAAGPCLAHLGLLLPSDLRSPPRQPAPLIAICAVRVLGPDRGPQTTPRLLARTCV